MTKESRNLNLNKLWRDRMVTRAHDERSLKYIFRESL